MLTIDVKLHGGAQPLKVLPKGDWIDLRTSEETVIAGGKTKGVQVHTVMIPLGISMRLPPGYEAIIASRSSTFRKYGIMPWNCIGVIDNSYNGTNDMWMYGALAFGMTAIPAGERIAQFRVQLSQKATIWQKVKWLLTGGKIRFRYVDKLSPMDRKGYGEGTADVT